MKRKLLSQAVLFAISSGFAAVSTSVSAQSSDPQRVERVEVTGSSIKRVDAETALPVTVISVDDLVRQGVTSVEQAMQRIAANQANLSVSRAIGTGSGGKVEVDLRGLGGPIGDNANKTLVLLDGRRMVNHAFDAAAVDLNAIPLAAIDRIEILRDGASAIYGTDAIGGVVNFILKKNLKGGEVSLSYTHPEAGSPGKTERVSLAAGFGDLNAQGFNLLGTFDYRKQKALAAVNRGFGSTGILGTSRAAITAGTSGTAFPGDVGGFEPSGPVCDPPFSVPRFTTATNGGAFNSCRYDFTKAIDLIPENEQLTALLKGNLKLGASHTLGLEYVYSNNETTARVAPAPTTHLIPVTSQYFPTGATARAITNPYTGATVQGNTVNWRQVPAGKRTNGGDTTTERALMELQGAFFDMDYRAAFGTSRNKSVNSAISGYVNDSLMQRGVWDGTINPFGTHTAANFGQSAAGVAAIAAAQVNAATTIGKATVDFFDFKASRELFKMGGGNAAVAFGVEHRREKSNFENTDITAELPSLGVDPDGDTSGRRNISAANVELNLPVIKGLDVTMAGRYDRYSDFGSTFNPKVSMRFQPARQFLLRGSYNKGFRAPTLYDIYGPASLTFTSNNYDDPRLCPGGTAVAGASAGVVCGQQVLTQQYGPGSLGQSLSTLQPEKSDSFTLGAVFEPINNLSFTLDVWQLKVRNLIGRVAEQSVFADPTKYASKFVRCSQLTPARRAAVSVCLNYPAFDPIAFIDSPTENLGNLKAQGVDLSTQLRMGQVAGGRVNVSLDGTLMTKYEYQRERGGEYVSALGVYTDFAPIFRWQHNLQVGWSSPSFGVTLAQRFKTGYVDADPSVRVGSYTLHDLTFVYTGVKNLSLSLAVTNLLDRDPPVTNQTTTFQRGYDPRFTDPLGRAYNVRLAYKF